MTCPTCGRAITFDPRFVRWCEFCEWNLDPSDTPVSARQTRQQEAAKRKGEALFNELRQKPLSKPGQSRARAAAMAIAAAIHAVTLTIFLAGIYVLVLNFPTFFGFLVGGLLIVIAILIRPRLGGVESGTVIMPAESAPALYRLTEQIAREIGSRPVHLIALDETFNAGHGQVGIQRRRMLWIGLPLWNVLTDEQRIGLLSHELAHQVNGDLAFGLVVGSALRTLESWSRTLRPGPWQPGGGDIFSFLESLGQLVARGLYRVLRTVVDLLYTAEESLLFASRQRAEYYADRVATRVASTQAVIDCLDVLHLSRPCILAMHYAAQREEADMWASEQSFMREFSAKEWERLRRLDARRGTAIDSTHPPTNLRVEMLKSAPEVPARVILTASEWAAIADEMSSGFVLVGDRITSRSAG